MQSHFTQKIDYFLLMMTKKFTSISPSVCLLFLPVVLFPVFIVMVAVTLARNRFFFLGQMSLGAAYTEKGTSRQSIGKLQLVLNDVDLLMFYNCSVLGMNI